jgi:hypothetical protein
MHDGEGVILSMIKKIILNIIAAICFLTVLLVIVIAGHEAYLFYKYDSDPNYALIERCHMQNGVWDSESKTCMEKSDVVSQS